MIVAPAVVLRDGRCVQLVGGRPDREEVSLPSPLESARQWLDRGFRTLHVVDLDAALGTSSNAGAVMEILNLDRGEVQVGGGVRSDEAAAELFGAGADRVIVGTRAVRDRPWLEALASTHPGRIMVAADTSEGVVLVRGWTEATTLRLETFLQGVGGLPLAGILVTDVSREGRLTGVDRELVRSAVRVSRHPLWIAGGLASIDDVRRVAEEGAHGAVLGMALYTGTIDADRLVEEFGE
jgi:phosphoribosylformimino-5-aminoimidazole carboxamide ribotide isomerase